MRSIVDIVEGKLGERGAVMDSEREPINPREIWNDRVVVEVRLIY